MKKMRGILVIMAILSILSSIAFAESTAAPKDFLSIAINDVSTLKSLLKAPDTIVLKGDVVVIEGKNGDVSLITYTAQNSYGVPIIDTAVFQGGDYVSSLDELEQMPDEIEREINEKKASLSPDVLILMKKRMQILSLQLEIQSAPLDGTSVTVSGEAVANELQISFDVD